MTNAQNATQTILTVRVIGEPMVPSFQPPAGFTAEGDKRKFVLIRQGGMLHLIVGWSMANNSYYHKEIVARVGIAGTVTGGGWTQVSWCSYEKSWSLKIHGSSGDFGVFDPEILKFKDQVSKELGLKCRFEWHG